MTLQQKNITKSLLKSILKICIAGVIIGLFHKQDLLIAVLLFLKVVHSVYSLGFKNNQRFWIVPIGMFICGILGILVEYIGTLYKVWEYHHINTQMPLWLPFAWMLAFSYIYKLEKELFAQINTNSLVVKSSITFFLALVFPAFGELITINLGVWTYYWPYQFLGLPVYALLSLVVFHMSLNILIYTIASFFKIKDPVFNH